MTAIERALVPLRNILGAVDGVMAEWADGEAGAELVPATIGQWAGDAIRELGALVEEAKAVQDELALIADALEPMRGTVIAKGKSADGTDTSVPASMLIDRLRELSATYSKEANDD